MIGCDKDKGGVCEDYGEGYEYGCYNEDRIWCDCDCAMRTLMMIVSIVVKNSIVMRIVVMITNVMVIIMTLAKGIVVTTTIMV